MMIQANELRVGCLIKKSITGAIYEVTPETIIKVLRMPQLYKPIPLTEEWLLKAGFVSVYSNEYWVGYKNEIGFGIHKSLHSEPSAGVEIGKFYHGENFIEIPTVHFLQNFYFFNTNKQELNFKQ